MERERDGGREREMEREVKRGRDIEERSPWCHDYRSILFVI